MRETRSTQAAAPDEEAAGLDLGNLLHALRRRWWLVPLSLILTVGLGVFYISVTPKTYRAEEVVEVEQSETKVLNIQDLQAEDLKEDQILKTIEQNFLSGEVVDRVIKKLNITPESFGLKPAPGGAYVPQALVEAVSKRMETKLQRGTRLITISAESTKPAEAQQLASTLVNEYIEADTAERMGVAGEANRFLLTQSDELKKRVGTAEQAAQEYKDAHPNIPLDDSQNFQETKLTDLTARMNDARQTRIRLQSDYEQAQEIMVKYKGPDETDKLLALQSVANDPAVLESEKSIKEEEAGLAGLAQRYLPKHPRYIEEQGKLREFRAGLDRAAIKAAGGLGTSVAAAQASEAQMQKILKSAENGKLENDRVAIPYASLTREVDRNRALYDSVQQRLKETDITANIDANNIRIITPATIPFKPVKPRSLLVLAASTVAGLMLSLGTAFAFSLADHTLKSVGEAESQLQLPAVGAIPVGEKLALAGGGFAILAKPHTPLAESFRTLRTALDLLGEDDEHKGEEQRSFLFTSATPGEGKSFCSVNYAISLAQLGRKTLLVDADLRLPVVEGFFFRDKKSTGLSALLEGVAELNQCFYATEVPNLFVMPAGKRSQSPAELMANHKFPAVLDAMLGEFDRVIIDSAPVHAVSDTLLITKYVSATCLVINAIATPSHSAQAAVQKLLRANSKLAGFILNRVPQSSSYQYYGGGSYGKGVYGAPTGA